jgi:hypothetical protein
MYIKKAQNKRLSVLDKLRNSETDSFKQWVKASCILLILVAVSAVGLHLTNASFASRPTGTLDIVTYEGSVAPERAIGSVNVFTDQGGSSVQCSPKGGTTDGAPGSNHGHLHLTCGAALNGSALTYVFLGATRDGYSISPNSPHHPGDTFHITGGQTTVLSIVLDGPPPPAVIQQHDTTQTGGTPAQVTTQQPQDKPTPTKAPDGTLDIVTYEGSVKDGNEVGNIKVTTDQGGSGVQCDSRSGYTDTTKGKNYGHVHLNCPAGADGGSRTYVLSGVTSSTYKISGSSPHQIGDAFHIDGNKTTVLSIVVKKIDSDSSSTTKPDSNSPKKPTEPNNGGTPYTPIPVKPAQPTPTNDVGRISVLVFKHSKSGQNVEPGDTKVGNVYVKADNIGVSTSLQCPDSEQRTGDGNGGATPVGKVVFSNCPVATAATDNHAKKYQVKVTIPSGYEIDNEFNNSVNAEKQGSSIVRTVTVRKNQTTDVTFLLIKPEVTASAASNPSGSASSDGPVASDASACHSQGCSNDRADDSISVRERIVSFARRELEAGRPENSSGSTKGQIDFMRQDYGNENGHQVFFPANPWCAFFVSYVYKKAGVSNPPNQGCSGYIGKWADARGSWHPIRGPKHESYKPRWGDAIIYSNTLGDDRLNCRADVSLPGSIHIGIVVKSSYSDGSFDTIEGNVDDRVVKRHRNVNSQVGNGFVLGFASPIKGQ